MLKYALFSGKITVSDLSFDCTGQVCQQNYTHCPISVESILFLCVFWSVLNAGTCFSFTYLFLFFSELLGSLSEPKCICKYTNVSNNWCRITKQGFFMPDSHVCSSYTSIKCTFDRAVKTYLLSSARLLLSWFRNFRQSYRKIKMRTIGHFKNLIGDIQEKGRIGGRQSQR